MIPVCPPSGAHIYFVLFASLVFADLRNISVDDAVLTGGVVPQYLPSASSWNQGNNCSKCLAKPNPSQAHNGTWHDTTFRPDSGISQAIEFTFIGSALYIFFILANSVPDATTLTDVIFYLDDIAVSTFLHSPSKSADYEYNVPVYVNESLASEVHNMTIKPIDDSGNSVLLLFDYLIYTTDTNSAATPSSTSSSLQQSTSSQNAAIIGGTLGGVAALSLVVVILLCRWRYKKRKRRQLLPWRKDGVLGSLVSIDSVASHPIPSMGPHGHPIQSQLSRPISATAPMTSRSPSPPVSVDPPSTASVDGNNTTLLQQVELLREEVNYLRRVQTLRMKATSG